MATGVKPRDDEHRLTRTDLETIQDAMKTKKFRDLLVDYCEEVRDPANQQLYQKEMTQLEKERGYDVTFLNPKGGYVIKTSVAGDRKAFINICTNDNVDKPTYKVEVVDGKRGMNWQIPYSIVPPREDYDQNRKKCVIYDVIFHPYTLRMAEVNKQFRELVNKTAFDALAKTYNIHLDSNNFRFPKSQYKGMATPAVIRKEDPNFQPPGEEETESLTPEMIEKLYPQHNYSENKPEPEPPKETSKSAKRVRKNNAEFAHSTDNGYTIPKYVIKQQKNVDLQDYTYHKDCKQYSAIPSHIVVEVYLPLLSSTKDCTLDVQEKYLKLASEKPAKYKLNITLPYSVNDDCGSAKFDKSRHMLIVTLPVIKKNLNNNNNNEHSLKIDSGVECEENSGSQSDEDNYNSNLIEELSSSSAETLVPPQPCNRSTSNSEVFLDSSLGYTLPPYTHNVLDDIVALTFHVKNTEPESVKVKNNGNEIYIKFTSVGAGFVPVHYAAIITFDDEVKFDNVTGEAWDNNVILQLELAGDLPHKFHIGLNKESMTCECFDVSQVKKTKLEEKAVASEDVTPVVEVTNLGTETNIVVSSNHMEYDEDDDFESPTSMDRDIVFTESGSCENGAKSILRKPNMMRSYSESSVGDVASSMDYISSDCIPEESSLKKTVRFSDVIARQFYRYNSSIEGQKKKNQRKKSKKRTQDRRKSESEAEDDFTSSSQNLKPRLKSVLKPRRDSGLADTSDAESESKNTADEGSCNSANEDGFSENDNNEKTSFQKSGFNIVSSGLADTSDAESAESESKNTVDAGSCNSANEDGYSKKDDVKASFEKSGFNIIDNDKSEDDKTEADIWESETTKREQENKSTTCDSIKHNTSLYDPDKLNKGQYLEVMFKNDLIFDLDM